MHILAIETSCDDTSIALVEATGGKTAPRFNVLANLVSSQTAIHRHWGGVVPNLAKREHLKNLPKLWKILAKRQALNLPAGRHGAKRTAVADAIAVTVGPGLEPALWTGIEFAKKLSAKLNVPLIGANHLEGHLYSFLLPLTTTYHLQPTTSIKFPTIALLVSGGHTILLHMKDLLHWKTLGETRDDAVGEAFDKVARMLELPYPGGPEIEKLARSGNPKAVAFPRPMLRENNYDFSFSGLKTAVLYYIKKFFPRESALSPRSSAAAHVAAAFQSAAIDVLIAKTIRAVREFGAKSVVLCGGVAANLALRAALKNAAELAGAQFIAPEMKYNSDNAAMIAAATYMATLKQESKEARKQRSKKAKKQAGAVLPLEANGNLGI